MINFIIGLIVGGFIGLFISGLIMFTKDGK